MLRPLIDVTRCQGCTPCLSRAACKTRALVLIEPGEPPVIELARCSGCGACVLACSFQALSMRGNGYENSKKDRGGS